METERKLLLTQEGQPSMGLQDLYKAACDQDVSNIKSEADESYALLPSEVKPFSFSSASFPSSVRVESNETGLTNNTVLDLDKGIPVRVIRKDTLYSADSDYLLHKFFNDHPPLRPDVYSSSIATPDYYSSHQYGVHNLKEPKNRSNRSDSNILKIDDCDFNSSDSFASTESIIPKKIICPKCPKKFMFKSDLSRHDKYKHKKIVLTCRCCNQEFSSRRNLALHEKARECPEIMCPLCNKAFKMRSLLNKHLKHKHKSHSALRCSICLCEVANAEELNNHRARCQGDSVFPCNMCNKKFRAKRSLQSHLKKHASAFICHICKETFQNDVTLADHVLQHAQPLPGPLVTEEPPSKPFKCEHCPKEYVNKHSFECHVTRHYSLVCRVCNESFSTEEELKAHSQQHLVVCNICSIQFTTRGSLNRHIKRKHNTTEQEAYTQTEEIFQLQNVNVVVDPLAGSSRSYLLATPITNLASLPIIIAQPQLNVPFSASS